MSAYRVAFFLGHNVVFCTKRSGNIPTETALTTVTGASNSGCTYMRTRSSAIAERPLDFSCLWIFRCLQVHSRSATAELLVCVVNTVLSCVFYACLCAARRPTSAWLSAMKPCWIWDQCTFTPLGREVRLVDVVWQSYLYYWAPHFTLVKEALIEIGCVVTSLVVDRWLVVTRVHCGQTVHPRPIHGTLIGNPTPGIQWYKFRPPGVTPNRGMGPPWGAFCQITLTSCYVMRWRQRCVRGLARLGMWVMVRRLFSQTTLCGRYTMQFRTFNWLLKTFLFGS